MAERAKQDNIDRKSLINITIQYLGSRRTAFFMSHSDFAIKSADLACRLFDSRNDADYVCRVPCDEKIQRSEILWAATLLSHLCQAADLTYDDVCDLTTVSVASYLHWILPNKAVSLLEGTQIILSQLAQVNNYSDCGPIFAVLAKALTAAKGIGEYPTLSGLLDKRIASAFSTQLWNISTTIKQLSYANVQLWSPYVEHEIQEGLELVKKWDTNGDCPLIQFRSGDSRHNLDWHMNIEIPAPKREPHSYYEVG